MPQNLEIDEGIHKEDETDFETSGSVSVVFKVAKTVVAAVVEAATVAVELSAV